MNNHKKIILSLTLLTLAMIHGWSQDNTTSQKVIKTTPNDKTAEVRTAKEISKIESEIYTALKKSNASSYRSILGGATSDEEIADYDNINLLSVKIVSDSYEYKIKLFYDESLLTASIFENFLDPVYSTADYIAEKNKIINPVFEIYVNNRLLRDILDEKEQNISSILDIDSDGFLHIKEEFLDTLSREEKIKTRKEIAETNDYIKKGLMVFDEDMNLILDKRPKKGVVVSKDSLSSDEINYDNIEIITETI